MQSFIHKDVIDKKICKDIIKYFNKNKKSVTKGKSLNISSNGFIINPLIKDSDDLVIAPNYLEYPFNKYQQQLQNCIDNYTSVFTELRDNVSSSKITESINIQKYNPGGGFKKLHCERSGIKVASRFLAFMTYLNTAKNGGTYFKYQNYKTDAITGDTYIWPAEWTHMHVGIVTSETKYIITGWLNFI